MQMIFTNHWRTYRSRVLNLIYTYIYIYIIFKQLKKGNPSNFFLVKRQVYRLVSTLP